MPSNYREKLQDKEDFINFTTVQQLEAYHELKEQTIKLAEALEFAIEVQGNYKNPSNSEKALTSFRAWLEK